MFLFYVFLTKTKDNQEHSFAVCVMRHVQSPTHASTMSRMR